jgi:hypothetical protein
MADELSAELDLSIKDALSAVDDLRDQIESAIKESTGTFDDAFAQAVSGIPPIAVEADTAALEPAITDAVTGIESLVPVNADTAPAVAAVDDFVTANDGREVSATLVLDTSDAVTATEDLASAAEDTGGSLDTAAVASKGFGTATALSSGSIDTLTNAVGTSVGEMGPYGAAIAGSVVALGAFTNSAVNSLGATQRLTSTFGEFATQIEHIQVGNLDTQLKDLATDTGSSGSAMRNAASDSFQMITSFGVGAQSATTYAAQVQALAARAVALNPELGETGAVAERLNGAFRSGRDKALVPYALGITSLEINARASQIALEAHRSEVTQADKAMAGAALASEKLGAHLKQDIAEGAQDPILQVRALTKEFASATTEIGKPLVAPMLDALKASLPSVQAVGAAIGLLAQAALPILTAALSAIAPLIEAFAQGLEIIGPAGIQIAAVVLGIGYALSNVTVALRVFDTALTITTAIAEANPFVLLATGIAIAVTALGIFGGSSSDAAASTDELTKAIQEQNGALDVNASGLIKKDLGDVVKQLNEGKVSWAEYTGALQAAGGMSTKNIGSLKQLNTLNAEGTVRTKDWVKILTQVSPALGHIAERLVRHNALTDEAKGKIISQAIAVAEGTQQAKEYAKAQIESGEATNFEKEKNDAALQAIKDHKQAVYETMLATQAATIATQAQAAEDLVATDNARAKALSARDFADGQRAVVTEMYGQVGAFSSAEDASIRYAFGIGTASELTDALTKATQELNSELDFFLGKFLTADEATNAYETAVLGLTDTLLSNGFSFDENTKAGLANQDALDQLGEKAQTAAGKILATGAGVDKARAPLDNFRGTIQKLRDDMANAGQDTSFLDGMIDNVDNAIKAITTKAPEFAPAAKTMGDNAGYGFLLGLAPIPGISSQAAIDAAEAMKSKKGEHEDAGKGGGAAAAFGFKDGVAPLPDHAAKAATDAGPALTGAAADLAGQGGPAFVAGQGVGEAFGAGIITGMALMLPDIIAEASILVGAAEGGARKKAVSASPSKLFAELGRDIGAGLSMGMVDSRPAVERSSIAMISQAASTTQSAGASYSTSTTRTSADINIGQVVLTQASPNPTAEAIATAHTLRRGATLSRGRR